jgi:hypothetical protein
VCGYIFYHKRQKKENRSTTSALDSQSPSTKGQHVSFSKKKRKEKKCILVCICKKKVNCGERGSNTRPSDLQSDALPTELSPLGWSNCNIYLFINVITNTKALHQQTGINWVWRHSVDLIVQCLCVRRRKHMEASPLQRHRTCCPSSGPSDPAYNPKDLAIYFLELGAGPYCSKHKVVVKLPARKIPDMVE